MDEVSSTELRESLGEAKHMDWLPESIRDEVKEYYQCKKKEGKQGG